MVILKLVVAPALILAATLVARRWGASFGGWLVALPLTSAPAAFFLMQEQGSDFARRAAIGMLAGTASQVAFALSYRALAEHGPTVALVAGTVGFGVVTAMFAKFDLTLPLTAALIAAVLIVAHAFIRRNPARAAVTALHRTGTAMWELPLRMAVATGIVLSITAIAPLIGAHLAGLLSPFPVFAAVLASFTHLRHGACEARASLDGLVLGLASPAVFFVVLAASIRGAGAGAFAVAAGAALLMQGVTALFLMRHDLINASARG